MAIRIVLIGPSGCGKTTAAVHLSESLGLAHIWQDVLSEGCRTEEAVVRAIGSEMTKHQARGWVFDCNYSVRVADRTWSSADLVVWLDIRPRQVLLQVARSESPFRSISHLAYLAKKLRRSTAQSRSISRRISTEWCAQVAPRARVVILRSPSAVERWLWAVTGSFPDLAFLREYRG